MFRPLRLALRHLLVVFGLGAVAVNCAAPSGSRIPCETDAVPATGGTADAGGDPRAPGAGGDAAYASDAGAIGPAGVEPRIAVRWRPLDHTVGACAFFAGELTLENHSELTIDNFGWKLYFTIARRILRDGEGNAAETQDLSGQGIRLSSADVAHSGDYVSLEPLPSFLPIHPGETRAMRLLVQTSAILKGDAPAAFHIVLPGQSRALAVHASVDVDPKDPKQTSRCERDLMPLQTPALRYDENALIDKQALRIEDTLVPRPLSVSTSGGTFALGGGTAIDYEPGLGAEAAYLRAALADVLAQPVGSTEAPGTGTVHLALAPSLPIGSDGMPTTEGYSLTIDANGVTILGVDRAGVFHGVQTLRQLVPIEASKAGSTAATRASSFLLPRVVIVDAPRFGHRGMSLDVARHFQSKEEIFKILDLLAYHKMNKLHFHLTDDEGWRLEIPGIPELTSYGARRGFDPAEREMLHASKGSTSRLGTGEADGIVGKPANEIEANGGSLPTYQGFEEASLNFAGTGSGHYSTREFEQILAYATERHIDVIPEIDVPSHARAAVLSMEYRYRKYAKADPVRAAEYRLIDPLDTSPHETPARFRDNFVNPCLDSTYAFLSKVVDEIKARYAAVPGAALTMIHGGGDELPRLVPRVSEWWRSSPACLANPATSAMNDPAREGYFLSRWSTIIASTGARMVAWDDVLWQATLSPPRTAPPGFVAMPWNNAWGNGHEDEAYKLANAGQPVILAHETNLYMSMAANKDPDEPGSYWADFVDTKKTFQYLPLDIFSIATMDRWGAPIEPSRWDTKVHLTDIGKAHVLGIEASIWSENAKTPGILEYFTFPKLMGVAERAWSRNPPTPATLASEWGKFCNTLGQEVLPRMDFYRAVDVRGERPAEIGVNYRIPLPGAKIEGHTLYANTRFPGMHIETSIDGGKVWSAFTAPFTVPAGVKVALRTRSRSGHFSRTATLDQ